MAAISEGVASRLGGHGVADEVAGHAGGFHVGRLEGEEREDVVDDPGHLPRAAGAPGPDRGGDVVDHPQVGAEPAGALRDAEREVGTVDGDERVGRHGGGGVAGLADAAEQVRQAREHLGQAHDRELLHGEAAHEALGGHGGAAHAFEGEAVAAELAEARDQRAAEEVARGLARDEEEAGHARTRRSRGSRRSRRPSPMRLRPRTVSTMARPGTSARCGAMAIMVWLSASIRPQEGVGGWAPRPT